MSPLFRALCAAMLTWCSCAFVQVMRGRQRKSDDLEGYLVFYKSEVKRVKLMNPREPIHFMAVRIRYAFHSIPDL